MKIASFLILFLFSNISLAGQDSGGTGEVHDAFINQANKIIEFLKYDPVGQKIQAAYDLNLCRLYQAIDDDLIFVFDDSNQNNRDHRGSIIDAYSYNWHIHLPEKKWLSYFREDQNVNHMIFKEMLRSEAKYMENAVEISNLIKGIDIEKNLPVVNMDYIKERKKWTPESCLSPVELKKYEKIHDGLLNAVIDESPICQSTNFDFSNIFSKADYLLKVSERNQCELKKTKCSFRFSEKSFNGNRLLLKQLMRGKSIIAEANVTLVSNEQELNFEDYSVNSCESLASYDLRLLCEKYAKLNEKEICEGPAMPRKVNLISTKAKITEHINLGLNIHPFYAVNNMSGMNKYIGKGSDIELLDNKIYRGHEIGVSAPSYIDFVKVKLVSNTIVRFEGKNVIFSNGLSWSMSDVKNKSIPKKDTIGYVMLTSTPWYYNKSQLGSKIERRAR